MTTVAKSSTKGKKTEFLNDFQSSILTSTILYGTDTQSSTKADVISFLRDSPAQRFQSQDSEKASTTTETNGRQPSELLSKYDQPMCTLRTYPGCSVPTWTTEQTDLFTTLELFSETWPSSGLMLGGVCWERTIVAPRIDGNESGSWPTPTADDSSGNVTNRKGNQMQMLRRCKDQLLAPQWQTPVSDDAVNRKNGKINSRGEPKLSAQVMWPTPDTQNHRDGTKLRKEQIEQGGNHALSLHHAVAKWPTPRANDAEKRGQIANDPRNGLPAAAQHWPTPHASCSTGAGSGPNKTGGDNLQTAVGTAFLSDEEYNVLAGTLNPEFVEWLMNWPRGWTSLEPLAEIELAPHWHLGEWEGVPRVATGVPNRVDRLKALGNGQVSICAATAWQILTSEAKP